MSSPHRPTVGAADLAARLADLDHVGADAAGGVTRLAWTDADAECGRWFAAQAKDVGLQVERDAAGNRWALPRHEGPLWAVGSHLDSVHRGGRFDGPLGVAAGLAIAAATTTPIAVISFADEEGARFNTPTFGSRAITGALDVSATLGRTDRDGIALADALRGAGLDPDGVDRAEAGLERLAGFLEIHIDQGTAVAAAGAPYAVAAGLAARRRLRLSFSGRADHAGTAAMDERRDALAAAAATVLIVERLARRAGARGTVGRLDVDPNAAATIPAAVTASVDLRAPSEQAVARLAARVRAGAHAQARARRVELTAVVDAAAPAIAFDAGLRRRLAAVDAAPETDCWAGHDAGWLARRRPAAMLLVRNPTGISHAPAEHVELDDAASAATAAARVLEVT